ncbi:hypothetical protein RRG08_007699 [Elysia crispata]|uniref:Uncharacterized protein n=1 Tax=Elysia crispata TaxID=231223 RepID=A0AAE0YUB2_9GAST|nr:hypothetical protein RRG08_007699 [Elysia crispata]
MVTPHLPLTPQTLVMKRPMHNCTLPTLVKKLHQLRLLCTTADGKEDIAKDNAAQSARQEMTMVKKTAALEPGASCIFHAASYVIVRFGRPLWDPNCVRE